MKLLAVYKYRDQAIYKFIYESIRNGYFWYYKDEVSYSSTDASGNNYKRVARNNT